MTVTNIDWDYDDGLCMDVQGNTNSGVPIRMLISPKRKQYVEAGVCPALVLFGGSLVPLPESMVKADGKARPVQGLTDPVIVCLGRRIFTLSDTQNVKLPELTLDYVPTTEQARKELASGTDREGGKWKPPILPSIEVDRVV